eukprot:6476337-Amphidinium_carterae.3
MAQTPGRGAPTCQIRVGREGLDQARPVACLIAEQRLRLCLSPGLVREKVHPQAAAVGIVK